LAIWKLRREKSRRDSSLTTRLFGWPEEDEGEASVRGIDT
jgi:hypothetical protein